MGFSLRVADAATTDEKLQIIAEGIDAILTSPRSRVPARSLECATPVVESVDVRQVWEAYQRIMRRKGAKLTQDRRRLIQARLKEGYTVDRIIRAIDGCAGSDFHMARGEYRGKPTYNGLEFILRNGSNVEKFEARPLPRETDKTLAGLRRALKYQQERPGTPAHVAIGRSFPFGTVPDMNAVYKLLVSSGDDIARAIELRKAEVEDVDAA